MSQSCVVTFIKHPKTFEVSHNEIKNTIVSKDLVVDGYSFLEDG
jgi:hypothetical protein